MPAAFQYLGCFANGRFFSLLLFQIILALGNYMNSSKRGAVYGFKLQSLDLVCELKDTRLQRLSGGGRSNLRGRVGGWRTILLVQKGELVEISWNTGRERWLRG